jgi:hypothetical protein
VLLLNECLLLFISLSTQSGNFWIHPRTSVLLGKDSSAAEWKRHGAVNEKFLEDKRSEGDPKEMRGNEASDDEK